MRPDSSSAPKWLERHAEDAALLLTAARLCMVAELWGKARSYLESSLAIVPARRPMRSYGQPPQESSARRSSAATAFRSGLALVTGGTGEFPALGSGADAKPSSRTSSAASTAASRATR